MRMVNAVVFAKTVSGDQSCLKIFNEDGLELSLAGDDSCGAHKKYNSRMSVAVFNGDFIEDTVEPDRPFSGDTDEFMQLLAKHLGYKVEKT